MPDARPILFVTRNFPPAQGGIETFAAELAKHGVAAGERLVLVHVGQKPCMPPPAGLAAYHHFPGTGRGSAILVTAFALPLLVLRHKPRLLVNMQVTTGLGGLLASRFFGVPYVVLCMGLEVLPGGSAAWRGLRGLILRGARRVISISRYTDSLAGAFGVRPENRGVIHPGTRLFPDLPDRSRARDASFGPESRNVFICLSLSRLVPRKGVDKVIEAIAIVAKVRQDIFYCVAGTGPDLPRLKAMVEAKGLGKHVRFLGRIADADIGPCYAGADLFVLPSRSSENPPDVEGFGIVFLEAAACGTPSLGGDSGGVPDAVRDGETGFLVDPEDPQAIADKILLLMSDREALRRLADQAHAHALESTWEKACSRYFAAMLS